VTGVFRDPYIFVRVGDVTTGGPATAVPCPACGKRDNFKEVLSYMPDLKGAKNECVHCGETQTVVAVRDEIRVRVA
jgi:uncharacterized Zn finger protein